MFANKAYGKKLSPGYGDAAPKKSAGSGSLGAPYANLSPLNQETTRNRRNSAETIDSRRQLQSVQAALPTTGFSLTMALKPLFDHNRRTTTPILNRTIDRVRQHPPAPMRRQEPMRSAWKIGNETWISAGFIHTKTRTKNSSRNNGIKIIKSITRPSRRSTLKK